MSIPTEWYDIICGDRSFADVFISNTISGIKDDIILVIIGNSDHLTDFVDACIYDTIELIYIDESLLSNMRDVIYSDNIQLMFNEKMKLLVYRHPTENIKIGPIGFYNFIFHLMNILEIAHLKYDNTINAAAINGNLILSFETDEIFNQFCLKFPDIVKYCKTIKFNKK